MEKSIPAEGIDLRMSSTVAYEWRKGCRGGLCKVTLEDEIVVGKKDSPDIVDDSKIRQEEVVDDKEGEFMLRQETIGLINKVFNGERLRRLIKNYKIDVLNPCRKGKKLLVLDIDQTLSDHRSRDPMRPYLHEFLSAAYAEYDIIIWSANSMKKIEAKLEQLGVLNNPNYKITTMLDYIAMINVLKDIHDTVCCKPLSLIWAKFPEFYSPKNTIMLDDLQNNFEMNPQNGLTIKPFMKRDSTHSSQSSDEELMKLTQYLLVIADRDDLSGLKHKDWEYYIKGIFKKPILASQPDKSFTRMGITITRICTTLDGELVVDQMDSKIRQEVAVINKEEEDGEVKQAHEAVVITNKGFNDEKLRRVIKRYKIGVHNPCRKGKKLLVLDIDHTLSDHRSKEPMRPYLHQFLWAVYAEYDIIIWSANSMKNIESKLRKLGLLTNPKYKITAILDDLAMIEVLKGDHETCTCKPLGVIWAKFPEFYSAKNTIMVDDLQRNFEMNPQNGLTIKQFRKRDSVQSNDEELMKLTQYLFAIAEVDDLSALNHNDWESYINSTSFEQLLHATQQDKCFTQMWGDTIPFWRVCLSFIFITLPLLSHIARKRAN